MLHLQSDPFFPRATSTKNFATAARDFCAFTHSGGRLLSLASLSQSPYGLLALVKALTANATTPLVLVGGIQNPNAVGSKFTKCVGVLALALEGGCYVCVYTCPLP
jgi:hypothetical protein